MEENINIVGETESTRTSQHNTRETPIQRGRNDKERVVQSFKGNKLPHMRFIFKVSPRSIRLKERIPTTITKES